MISKKGNTWSEFTPAAAAAASGAAAAAAISLGGNEQKWVSMAIWVFPDFFFSFLFFDFTSRGVRSL